MSVLILVALFFNFVCAKVFANGELTLVITKTEDDIATLVQSSLNIGNGSNFSLSCNCLDSEKLKQINFNTWIKKTKKFTLPNTHQDDVSSYICTCLSDNMVKIVRIIVKPQHSKEKRSTSRETTNESSGNSLNNDEISSDGRRALDDQGIGIRRPSNDAPRANGHNLYDKDDKVVASSIVTRHNGVTNIFLIGLFVSFVITLLLATYHIIKCWRTGTLSLFRNGSCLTYRNNNSTQREVNLNQDDPICIIDMDHAPAGTPGAHVWFHNSNGIH